MLNKMRPLKHVTLGVGPLSWGLKDRLQRERVSVKTITRGRTPTQTSSDIQGIY